MFPNWNEMVEGTENVRMRKAHEKDSLMCCQGPEMVEHWFLGMLKWWYKYVVNFTT